MGTVGCTLALPACWVFHLLQPISNGFATFFLAVVCTLLLFVLNEKLFSELMPQLSLRAVVLTVILGLLWGANSFSPWLGTLLLVFYLHLSLHDLRKNFFQKKQVVFTNDDGKMRPQPHAECIHIDFLIKPNVYIFFLESFNSAKAIRRIYKSEVGAKTQAFLESMGYVVYPDANANLDYTVNSLTTLVENRYPLFYNEEHALPEPFTFRVFKENGYSLSLFDIDNSPFVLGRYADMADQCSFRLPRRVRRCFAICGPLFAQTRYVRFLVEGLDPAHTEAVGSDTYYTRIADHIRKSSTDRIRPHCSIIRFGARHTNYINESTPVMDPSWEQTYLDSYAKADAALRSLVTEIDRHDPDASVIIVGDHGAHNFDYTWRNPKNTPAPVDMLYDDIFSVLTAIKWPGGNEPKGFEACHVNLTIWLFMALSGDKTLCHLLQPNICLGVYHQCLLELHLFAQKRVPLTQPLQCEGTELALRFLTNATQLMYGDATQFHELALRQIVFIPATEESLQSMFMHLEYMQNTTGEPLEHLVRKYFSFTFRTAANGIRILKALQGQISDSPYIQNTLFDCHCKNGNISACCDFLLAELKRGVLSLQAYNKKRIEAYYRLGRFNEAWQLCTTHRVDFQGDFNFFLLSMKILYAKGEYNQVYNNLSTYKKHQHDKVSIRHASSLLYWLATAAKQGETTDVDDDLGKRLTFWQYLAFTAVRTGHWDTAIEAFEMLRAWRSDAWWSIMECYALLQVGRSQKACTLALKTHSTAPKGRVQHQIAALLGILSRYYGLQGIELDKCRETAEAALAEQEKRIAQSKLFTASGTIRSWLTHGVFVGAMPNPYFDPFFYIMIYGDVRRDADNPLVHYILFDTHYDYGRYTSPSFCAGIYANTHPELIKTGGFLLHLLQRPPNEEDIYA